MHKSGKRDDLNKYRGTMPLNIMGKPYTVTVILRIRITHWVTASHILLETQFVFCKYRRAIDCMNTERASIESFCVQSDMPTCHHRGKMQTDQQL